jgi:hypothetical protein
MKTLQINSTHAMKQLKTGFIVLFLVFSFTRCSDEGETYVPVTSITASEESLTLEIGETETLTATISPSNATTQRYSWESSNLSVASVNNSGVVTGVAGGTADIIVKALREECTDTVKVTVLGEAFEVNGTYLGVVTMDGTPVGANIPLEIQYASAPNTISIDAVGTINIGVPITLHVHGNALSITRDGDVYTISGDAITDNYGYGDKDTTIEGTIDSDGTISLILDIDSITETVAYNGQKEE